MTTAPKMRVEISADTPFGAIWAQIWPKYDFLVIDFTVFGNLVGPPPRKVILKKSDRVQFFLTGFLGGKKVCRTGFCKMTLRGGGTTQLPKTVDVFKSLPRKQFLHGTFCSCVLQA